MFSVTIYCCTCEAIIDRDEIGGVFADHLSVIAHAQANGWRIEKGEQKLARVYCVQCVLHRKHSNGGEAKS